MSNSTVKLQSIVDDASSLGDVSPALATGGLSDGPALSIATDVMQAIINGGPGGQPYNWKWNRFNTTPFLTNSYQQDYFVPNLVNLGWMESCWAVDINSTAIPKPKTFVDSRKDLSVTSYQTGQPERICAIPNTEVQTGIWGGSSSVGLSNPGPNVVYTNPLQSVSQPSNPIVSITDPNGNLWVLTTYGTCGATQPAWPTTPVYPTTAQPALVSTTVADGTCVWTAINPGGQGFRLNPIPPQTGILWQVQPVAQYKARRFTNLAQTLEPLPDDWDWAFKQGFFAECYRRNPDPRVRSRYTMERQLWMEALDKSVRQADREQDAYGFVPASSIMSSYGEYLRQTPAYPFQG